MAASELFGQRGRLFAGILLCCLLAGMMVWAGTTTDDPLEHQYPTDVEVTPTPETYVGEQVVLGGQIVDTDPVVIATRASGYGRFLLVDANDQVQNVDGALETGDHVTVFGTLTDEEALVVEHGLTQNPDDRGYMFLVSILGGLLVAGRFLNGWRFDRKALAFVPRSKAGSRGNEDAKARSQLDGENEVDRNTQPTPNIKRGGR
ncbi:Slp family lipoprotein [Natronosalvus vescus]|uniref:Slp family lipoprotein n=1 Tax=Natronosalvus vescus TaxID=2953881 RepID=UPI002091623D|nr:Slp family lipoprotein [Natronosalvus vescus]